MTPAHCVSFSPTFTSLAGARNRCSARRKWALSLEPLIRVTRRAEKLWLANGKGAEVWMSALCDTQLERRAPLTQPAMATFLNSRRVSLAEPGDHLCNSRKPPAASSPLFTACIAAHSMSGRHTGADKSRVLCCCLWLAGSFDTGAGFVRSLVADLLLNIAAAKQSRSNVPNRLTPIPVAINHPPRITAT